VSNQTLRTISRNSILDPVSRTAIIPSPNSYSRLPNGAPPKRSAISARAASGAVKSKAHVLSKTNSINPQSVSRRPISGSSTRDTKHSKENDITPSRASTRSKSPSSCHLRNTENASAWAIIDPPRFRLFAPLPAHVVRLLDTIRARRRAAISHSSVPQPSPELLGESNGRGRNYSARNAKRKRLLSLSVSSRKHLSAA